MEKWDGTPEGMWRVTGDLAQFFLERDVNSAPKAATILALFLEMHCRQFPEDRIPLGSSVMKMMQSLMTNNKGSN